jgi:acetyltransferase-like isoleucine patch superfamily enzyme
MIAKLKLFIKRYGLIGCIKHLFYYINTFIFYRRSRLIRLPIEIRGASLIDFGAKLTTGKNCRIEAFVDESNYLSKEKTIFFGKNVVLNDNVHIAAKYSVKIGNDVLIASKVFISDHNHGIYSGSHKHSSPFEVPNDRAIFGSQVVIEDNVWLGEFVVILPGITIGKGSIIGAMSVVTKSIPPNSIAVGSPAKIIKTYDIEERRWKSNK